MGPVELTLSRLLIVAGLAALVATEGIRRELFNTRLAIPIALLLIAGLATTIKWGTEPRYRFLIESVALFYLTFAVARAYPESRRALLTAALIALSISALSGIAQISQDQATGFYRDGCEPVTAAPPLIPEGTITRATGTFSNPNLLAGHLLLLLPLGAAAVAGGAGRVAALAVGLGYLALALTYSRSAIFFALLALGAAAAVSGLRHRGLVAAAAVALALGASFLFAACGSEAGAGYGRGAEWSDAISIAADNPVYGVGLGRLGDVLSTRDARSTTAHAHNLFINWWAEAGPAALVAWIWILGLVLWRTLRATMRGDPLARWIFVALAGFVGFSLLDHPANVDRVATALWIVVALAAAVTAGGPDRARTTSASPSSRAA